MLTTWVIIASRDQARLFSRNGQGKLALEWEVGNPAGRLKNGDINSDKHGASTDNRFRAQQAYSSEEEPRERLLRAFYRSIFAKIEHDFAARRVDRLVMAAEPRLLGILRPLLPPALDRALTQEIHKDLWHEGADAISDRLG